MGARQCEVCKEGKSKYKCPTCLIPYCSVPCFKKHKEIPCNSTSSPVKDSIRAENPLEQASHHEEDQTTTVLPERSCIVEEEHWVLNRETLISLVESKEIQDALTDKELQNMINKIDRSNDPEDELDKAMKGQMFHEFTSKILDIVSPQ